jgi:predicted GNAT family acetyltransferase
MPPASDQPEIEVRDNRAQNRFEARVGAVIAAFVTYRLLGQRVVVLHTEVKHAFTGRGVGRRLVQAMLDDIRRRGLRVTPICPFMAAFIERHPAYSDLVSWGRERAP